MTIRFTVLRGLAVATTLTLIPLVGVAGVAHAAAPGPVTGLAVYTHIGSATIAWTQPTSADHHDTVVQLRVGTAAPRSVLDGVLVTRSGSTVTPKLVIAKTDNVATVDGLDPGTDFTIGVFARDAAGAASAVTSRTIFATDLALKASRTSVVYGDATTFTARLRRSTGTASLAGEPVDFYVRRRGTRPWFYWDEKRTNASGVASTSFRPGLNIEVQAYFFGSPNALGSTVTGPAIGVRQRVAAAAVKAKRKRGKTFTIRGSILAKNPSRVVYVDRFNKGAWRAVKAVRVTGLKTSAGSTTGRFTYTVKIKKKGTRLYRVRTIASASYVATTTRSVKLRAT